MAHTPGPWTYDNTDPEGGTILAQYPGSPKGRFRVALVDDKVEAVDANARLIAAAPELLAALRELRAAFAHVATSTASLALLDRTSAAIAKAEGE